LNTNRIDKIAGWIDDRRRPLVNLRVWRAEAVCALVDTGFNGYLLWECSTKNGSDFPGALSSLYESVEVAGATILVNLAVLHIQWFDEEGVFTPVETLVSLSGKPHSTGNPSALLGTAQLSGMKLVIDFLEATLRIERSR
jgi:predicted aspartyl protease